MAFNDNLFNTMKIISWNINGLRAIIKKDFEKFLKNENPDIICLQEIKISKEVLEKENISFPNYKAYWNSALRPGYSGTGILIKKKIKPISQVFFPHDDEGRVGIIEFKEYFLINVYFPNANRQLSRMDFKIKFNNRLLKFLKKIEKEKPLVICGDYNVAHQEIDLARPKENMGHAGFTDTERNWINKFFKNNFIDIWRTQNPDEKKYTWWSYMRKARERDIGWRIDYFCISKILYKKIKKSFILTKVNGSDHCPIGIRLTAK